MKDKKNKKADLTRDERLALACEKLRTPSLTPLGVVVDQETFARLVEQERTRYALRSPGQLANLAALWRVNLTIALQTIKHLGSVVEDSRISNKMAARSITETQQQRLRAAEGRARKLREKAGLNDEEIEIAVRNYLHDPKTAKWSSKTMVEKIWDRHLLPDNDPERLVLKGRRAGTFEVSQEAIRKSVLRIRAQIRKEA
jgi:hypothetical protein